jgi:hypothetical protein
MVTHIIEALGVRRIEQREGEEDLLEVGWVS